MQTNNPVLEQALKDEKQKQETSLVLDYDQAIKEAKAQARTVKLDGKEYKVPRQLPFWVQTYILRNLNDKGILSHDANLYIIENVIGKDFADMLNDPEKSKFLSVQHVNETLILPLMQDAGIDSTETGSGNMKTPES